MTRNTNDGLDDSNSKPFAAGAVVRYRPTGRLMTITKVLPESCVGCVWFPGLDAMPREAILETSDLELVELSEEQKRAMREKFHAVMQEPDE